VTSLSDVGGVGVKQFCRRKDLRLRAGWESSLEEASLEATCVFLFHIIMCSLEFGLLIPL
jgi:hypothetical protein